MYRMSMIAGGQKKSMIDDRSRFEGTTFLLTTIKSLESVLLSGKVGVNCASRGVIDRVT